MNEKEILDATIEVAKEIAQDVYVDLIRPVAKPTGEILGLVPRAIKAALSPLEKLILQREYNIAEIRALLEEKLKNVSPDLIEAPEPYIAIPTMQHMSYCIDNSDLRNMYANLLASSMKKDIKDEVHPAYVEIIKQLCPDEARILQYLLVYNTIPIVGVKYYFKNGSCGRFMQGFDVIAKFAKCEYPHNGRQYFDNLIRLGFIRESNNPWFFDEERFDKAIEDEKVQEYYNYFSGWESVIAVEYVKEVYEITTFCERFIDVCVDVPDPDMYD